MANASRSGILPCHLLPARARLTRSQHVAGGVQRAGGSQQSPLLHLSRAVRPARGHHNELRAPPCQLLELLGEANVVADCQPDRNAEGLEGHEGIAGAHGIRLAVVEGVVGMHLLVAAQVAGSGNERGVGHTVNGLLAALHAIRGGEHSGHDEDTELFRQAAHGGGELPV